MLNSFPKFKTRDLPGLKIYLERKGRLPECIVFGLAAIITYYKGGKRGSDDITPNDAPEILDLLKTLWATDDCAKVAKGVLSASGIIWDEDLTKISGLTEMLTEFLTEIQGKGMKTALERVL